MIYDAVSYQQNRSGWPVFDGVVLLHGAGQISHEELKIRLVNAAKQQPVPELHIHADRNLDYGKVADIMALSSRSGVSKIAFVSEPAGE